MPVWSIVCVVVRSGHRRKGVTAQLIEGAVDYAASRGAPAVEAYPVEPEGRMDTTMAFVGTRSMFENAGFEVIGTTNAVASGLPRLIVRRTLRIDYSCAARMPCSIAKSAAAPRVDTPILP